MTFGFASPWLLLLALPAVAAVVLAVRRRQRREAACALPDAAVLLRAGVGWSPWVGLERALPLLRGLVLLLLVVGLARPQSGSRVESVQTFGVDIVVALDVSSSMRAEDLVPNRLEAARRTAQRFIEGRPEDRIGLVLFAGLATPRCPLTQDHGLLQQLLDEVEFASRDQDGTALGMGLAAAVNRLRRSDAKSKVVVLVTDGRNNRGQIAPLAAAEAARVLGVKVYTVGVGTEGEAPVTIDYGPLGQRRVMQALDLDEPLLREVAEITGARYFRATDTAGLNEVFQAIDALEQTEIESSVRVLQTERFSFAVLPALLLFGLERLLAGTRLQRIP